MEKDNNKYSNAKIYKIVSNINDDVYYGSTVESLSNRLAKHRAAYKHYLAGKSRYITSFKILETNDYDIVLVEKVNCNSKEELHQKERFYIENNACVNKVRPNRTVKEYYNDNKENIQAHRKTPNNCPCGGDFTTTNKSIHLKTSKHQSYIKDQESKQIKLSQNSFNFVFEMDSLMLLPKTYTNIIIVN